MTSVGCPTLQQRFEGKVRKADGCWEWIGAKKAEGYGEMGVGPNVAYAHRIAYELYVGPIPVGLCVCHHCDNPGCVNPSHLFIGTRGDNRRDAIAKGRIGVGPDMRAIIRREWQKGGLTRTALAEKLGVPLGQVEHSIRDLPFRTARMTQGDAAEIRRAYAAGEGTLHEIGERFNLSQSMVSRIVNGSRWAEDA